MTPQEKIRWFWAIGELPGTMFDDLNDLRPKVPEQSRCRQAKRRQLGSRKGTKKHWNTKSRASI